MIKGPMWHGMGRGGVFTPETMKPNLQSLYAQVSNLYLWKWDFLFMNWDLDQN